MLDKSALKTAMKQAFEDQRNKETDWEAALDDLCTKLSNAIDDYVKGAKINYVNGLTAQVPVTGTFNGSLS